MQLFYRLWCSFRIRGQALALLKLKTKVTLPSSETRADGKLDGMNFQISNSTSQSRSRRASSITFEQNRGWALKFFDLPNNILSYNYGTLYRQSSLPADRTIHTRPQHLYQMG